MSVNYSLKRALMVELYAYHNGYGKYVTLASTSSEAEQLYSVITNQGLHQGEIDLIVFGFTPSLQLVDAIVSDYKQQNAGHHNQ